MTVVTHGSGDVSVPSDKSLHTNDFAISGSKPCWCYDAVCPTFQVACLPLPHSHVYTDTCMMLTYITPRLMSSHSADGGKNTSQILLHFWPLPAPVGNYLLLNVPLRSPARLLNVSVCCLMPGRPQSHSFSELLCC